jgi:arabinofuranan 3-O-arabinosyltransferase
VGVIGLLALAIVPEGSAAERLALLVIVGMSLATATGWLQLLLGDRSRRSALESVQHSTSRAWPLVTVSVLIIASFAAQTWFRPGATISGGDLDVPNGTAWLSRLFQPWGWDGSTLGEASNLSLKLPWGAVLGLVHTLGGDPALAQRIWYTSLFTGAALSALALLASLRMSPVAAFVGTFVYLFNPYVLTWVNTWDNYLLALSLLAGLPAALIAASSGQLSTRSSAMLVAISGPLIGYAFLVPPLVGMILALMLVTPLVATFVYGRAAGLRCLRALALGLALLLVASAYWIVPTLIHLSSAIPSQLASLSDWTWTESRATLRNGLWLNAHWAWSYPEYFPYAPIYDLPPISFARFLLPAVAFSGLAITTRTFRDQGVRRERHLRIAVVSATIALSAIVLSTGTNPPGNVIFDPLYRLPYGWLLREPTRFLMLACLAYAVLVAVAIDAFGDEWPSIHSATVKRLTKPSIRLVTVPVTLVTMLLLGLPFYTGAIVPDVGRTLPVGFNSGRATHVRMPAYWADMAQFVNSLPVKGNLLIMPPDDLYQMPYTWYYGTDEFVIESFNRLVVMPDLRGYAPALPQLATAVNLTAQSILDRNWAQADALVRVLDTPLILVRRDIQTPYPGHSTLSPWQLADALAGAPNFKLIRTIGSLDLFRVQTELAGTEVAQGFATINSATPDLRLLSQLPTGTALISSEPRPYAPSITQAPAVDQWSRTGATPTWQTSTSPGRSSRVTESSSGRQVDLGRAGTYLVPLSRGPVLFSPSTDADPLVALMTAEGARTTIANGAFANGLWGPVSDCDAVAPALAKASLRAVVLPNAAPRGLPALQLAATFDSACEMATLDWHGGPLVLGLLINHVQGAAPRICLWEIGPNRCASIPPLPDANRWSSYVTSIRPDSGTTALQLYLYADAHPTGTPSIEQYADVRAVEVPSLPNFSVRYSSDTRDLGVMISVAGRAAILNGDFVAGPWGQVADCHDVKANQAGKDLKATILSNATQDGLPALELAASFHSACVSAALDWKGGPLLLSLMIRHVSGSAPRLCLWETGPEKCALLPTIPDQRGWFQYHSPVTIDPGTTAINLYLYSDGGVANARTINDYAKVGLIEVASLPAFALLASPDLPSTASPQLVVVHSTYSTAWEGSRGEHVIVDGMLNGWLVQDQSQRFSTRYRPTMVVLAAQLLSLALAAGSLLFVIRHLIAQLIARVHRS